MKKILVLASEEPKGIIVMNLKHLLRTLIRKGEVIVHEDPHRQERYDIIFSAIFDSGRNNIKLASVRERYAAKNGKVVAFAYAHQHTALRKKIVTENSDKQVPLSLLATVNLPEAEALMEELGILAHWVK
jgi:hypothetical protein